MTEIARFAIAATVLALLARAASAAWRHRRVAVAVWRRIRLHHLVGSVALAAVCMTVAVMAATFAPITRFGLGSLVGLHTNAVFAPVEDVILQPPPQDDRDAADPNGDRDAAGGAGSARRDTAIDLSLITGFCVLLLALFPWLAFVEERTFREGLEHASLGRQAWIALRFGLAHLVMLIPIAAALAIGVAGFAYGLIYRHAYARALTQPIGVAAAMQATRGTAEATAPSAARSHAVLTSTVWHTTFNSLLVVALLFTVFRTLAA